jgi:hypothetical protein
MATLQVKVSLSSGVLGYSLFVDGVLATMGPDHRGEVGCAGQCGDGSAHALIYSFGGLAGSTLDITLRCAEHIVCRLRTDPIPAGGPRWTAGREPFAL